MKVRLKPHVYIRHADNESVVICPRTGGCTLMRDARPFLDRLNQDWQEIEDINASVAVQFKCEASEVFEDTYRILGELEDQDFIEREGWKELTKPTACPTSSNSNEEDDASPFVDFCDRHKIPAELHIDLTDRCNERCVHCYIPKGGGTTMPTELAINVLREFREAQGLTVFITGGECMLHPDFADILREAKQLGLNIVVMSNLLLCDEKQVELLKEIDPQFVNVSLYSMKAEDHDAITQMPKSHEKTMRAILCLEQAGVHVRLATPIMKVNRDGVDELRRFASEHKMHDIFECDIIGRMDHDCSNQQHALTVDELEGVVRAHRDILLKRPRTACQCTPEARVCDVGDWHLCINASGDYYPCDGFHGMVLGNANTDALSDVWRGDKLNFLRSVKNRDFGACATCRNRPWCKVCMMRNFNETGDMFRTTPERCKLAAMYHKLWEEE